MPDVGQTEGDSENTSRLNEQAPNRIETGSKSQNKKRIRKTEGQRDSGNEEEKEDVA